MFYLRSGSHVCALVILLRLLVVRFFLYEG
uniref:Uncharacterized protein n=1 Tax=Arundo donax TaxID=35708 RepID=A0A0A9B8N0_ARUDO